jgi:DNA-binding response OmpR family regulator
LKRDRRRDSNSRGPHDLQIRQEVAIPADRAAAPAERAIAFGPFRLLPTRRLLLRGRERVHLGSRALEILLALVERHGELVSKSERMARVWPDTFVEEGNLKVQGRRLALDVVSRSCLRANLSEPCWWVYSRAAVSCGSIEQLD